MSRDQERYRFRPVPLLIYERWRGPPVEVFESRQELCRQKKWLRLNAARPNHSEQWQGLRVNHVFAAVRAHNLRVGGRRGEWA